VEFVVSVFVVAVFVFVVVVGIVVVVVVPHTSNLQRGDPKASTRSGNAVFVSGDL